MKLPSSIVPILTSVAKQHSLPVEIWQADDGDRIIDAFIELAVELKLADLPLQKLPRGYLLVRTLWGWEQECQCEAWNAFGWTANRQSVIDAYLEVGLDGEAQAISRALSVWLQSPENYDAIDAAYEEASHAYMIDFDRMEYLVEWFCSHASELFYEV